jgi:hypothetical protein
MPRLRSTLQSMDTTHLILLFLPVGLIAFLYSSVGHAGASGYIATMTLFGLAPTVVRPTSLVLNILVASIGTFQFWRAVISRRNYSGHSRCFPFRRIRLRLPATVCFGSPNFDRRCAAFFRRAPGVSPKRPTANDPPVASGGDQYRSRAWFSFRPNWNWRRNISHAAIAVLSMGTHPPGRGCFGVVHLGELDRRAGWPLYKSSVNSFARSHSRAGGDRGRDCGIAFGQQAFCCLGDFVFIGDRPTYRGDEIAFH